MSTTSSAVAAPIPDFALSIGRSIAVAVHPIFCQTVSTLRISRVFRLHAARRRSRATGNTAWRWCGQFSMELR
jgi:hypothetical protein